MTSTHLFMGKTQLRVRDQSEEFGAWCLGGRFGALRPVGLRV